MQYKIELRGLAVIEILEAFDWYELQQTGLGSDFLNELDVFTTTLIEILKHIRILKSR